MNNNSRDIRRGASLADAEHREDNYKYLLVGGVSRGIVITVMFPIDTIKTRLQNNSINVFKPPFYYGYKTALLSQVSYGMAVFGTYENMKIVLNNNYPNIPQVYKFLTSAIISDLTGSLILTPGEVVKQNIQIGKYNSILNASINIVNNDGLFGFYKGYSGLIARDIPFRAIQLPLYDTLKNDYNYNNIYVTSLFGVFASMVAGAITNPIDVIKTQMMCSNKKENIKNTILQIYNNYGYKGFFAGILQRISFLGGSSFIFFFMYENLLNYIN
jgi:solute carrier family 25 S-adenosylmethionine transporter 26